MKLFDFLLVGMGGCFGAIGRFLIADISQRLFAITYPLGTLIANVAGCFLIGLLMGAGKFDQSDNLRLSVGVGFLGGLTTFSSFSAETISHFQQGHYATAGTHVVLNLALGLTAVVLGLFFGKNSVG